MKNGGAPGAPVDFSTETQAENGGPRRFQISFLGKVSYRLGEACSIQPGSAQTAVRTSIQTSFLTNVAYSEKDLASSHMRVLTQELTQVLTRLSDSHQGGEETNTLTSLRLK